MDTKDRIRVIIEQEGLSQVEFSTKTGIKTSTLSHVLTGRNNASAEVIEKILAAFPKYETGWLVHGDGPMVDPAVRYEDARRRSVPLFQDPLTPDPGLTIPYPSANDTEAPRHTRRIEKVIIYYDDNTYEVLVPSESRTK